MPGTLAPRGGKISTRQLGRSARRGTLAALLAACVGLTACGRGGASRPAPERVLLVTLDTTRADRLGCYGYRAGSTPVLDRLAREGVRFAHAVAPAPLTLPSHATLLTGTYPARHGVRNNGTYRLGAELPTLAERFRDAGYQTAAVVGSVMLASQFGLDRGFQRYDDEIPPSPDKEILAAERPAGEVTRRALRWIRDQVGYRWFLWVHYFDPHFPYSPPEPYASRFRDQPYDGEVAATDSALGDLISGLEAAGLLENTLIVVTADHGESLGEHGEHSHGLFIYESTMRVPLILSWGRGLPHGRVVDDLVRLVDVAPTLLDLSGLSSPTVYQGESLSAVARGGSFPGRAALIESWLPRLNYGWSELVGVQLSRWKYIRAPRSELYDLVNDPGEQMNLLSRQPAVAERCEDELGKLLEEASAGHPGERAPGALQGPELRRALRGLGYLGALDPDDSPGRTTGSGGARAPEELADPKDKLSEFLELSGALPLLAMGRIDEGVERLERAEVSNPGSVLIKRQLGNAYREQGRLREAEAKLRAAARLAHSNVGARVDLAAVLLERPAASEAMGEAESLLREALKEDPNLATAHHLLGVLYLKRGLQDRASAEYRAALDLDPSRLPSLVSLALILEERGELREAIALYLRAMEIEPSNARLRTSAAWLQFRLGNLPEAEALLLRAAELEPASPKPLQALVEVRDKAGNPDGAFEVLNRAAALEQPAGEASLELGVRLILRGDSCGAVKKLGKVAERGKPALREQALREQQRARRLCTSPGETTSLDGP